MSSLNGVTYICSAGLSSVTSAGTLGPYFALTYFLPVYDFRIDKTICDTSAIGISSLNYTSATHSSLNGLEIIYNNPEVFGQGSYNILNFNSLYSRGTSGSESLFTNTRQRNGDNKINVLNGKVLQNQVSAVGFSNIAPGSLSAVGTFTSLTGTSVNSWNPLSGTSTNWDYRNLFKVTSYSPNQSTSGIASGNYKCRIPAGTGSFKFNMVAIYATRVNQYGYADPGVVGSPYNPTLFAIVVFDNPQIKSDTTGSLNAFEVNVELTFSLSSSAATPIYVNTDYFTRIPTSNTTSAYALNYDGDVVISSSASPGSWVPRAKLTITDPEKTQVRLAHDDTRFTTITTNRFKPYSTYSEDAEMAVLDIDTSCPDDALLQLGYNCVSTGIKSIAMGCYSSATGYEDSGSNNFGEVNPPTNYLYTSERGGYTLAIGVENIAQGLLSTSLGYQTSSIGYGSFAGGYAAIASSEGMNTTYNSLPSEGLNFSYGFRTSAIAETDSSYPGGYSPSSLSNWFNGIVGYLAGGNAAFNIQTLAKGNANVAFNINSTAYGTGNVAFGMNTSALNILTIATGLNTISDGILSQAHGQYTSANAILSYVYGGLAKADTNAHGSLTFGSPYIYGSGSGSTGIYFPGYIKSIWIGSAEQVEPVPSTSQTIDKYIQTYNDGMGTFVFGQGTSAYSQALQSFVAGICNKTYSQGSTIFGNSNEIFTNSGFSSVIGGKNTIISSPYSSTNGFFNSLTSSESSYVRGISNSATNSYGSFIDGVHNSTTSSYKSYIIGSDNALTIADYSTAIGYRNNLTNSYYANVFGDNNSVSGTYVGVFGNNSYVTNCVDSFAIGNNIQLSAATNSLALGYGAQISTNNTIQIGSCSITSANIQANNIVLDAKTCTTKSNRTKILLKADDIELDGFTGQRQQNKYKLYVNKVGRRLYAHIYKYRCDEYSGDIKAIRFSFVYVNNQYKISVASLTNPNFVDVYNNATIIKSIYVNLETLDLGIVTQTTDLTQFSGGSWHLLFNGLGGNLFNYVDTQLFLFNNMIELEIINDTDPTDIASPKLDIFGYWIKNNKYEYFTSSPQIGFATIFTRTPISTDSSIGLDMGAPGGIQRYVAGIVTTGENVHVANFENLRFYNGNALVTNLAPGGLLSSLYRIIPKATGSFLI